MTSQIRQHTVTVRHVLSRALLTVELWRDARDRHVSPRLSMMMLGNLMNRRDLETALDISRDIEGSDPGLADQIRCGWTGSRSDSSPVRIAEHGLSEDLVRACRQLIAASERGLTRDEQKLLHVATRLYGGYGGVGGGWAMISPHFPGRTLLQLRRSYDRVCLIFYRRNEELIRHTAELLERDAETARAINRSVQDRLRVAKRSAREVTYITNV